MSPVLPREERDAIRARADAATPGPWDNDGDTVSQNYTCPEPWAEVVTNDVRCSNYCYGGTCQPIARAEDAEFIAHARTDVPALLDALDAAEEENGRLTLAEQGYHWQVVETERVADALDAARAEVAALRGRIGHIIDRYGDAHDARDCAVLHDLRALAADEGERTGQ